MTTGEATWDDYRLNVRLLSDTDQGIGVLFRYQTMTTTTGSPWTGRAASADSSKKHQAR